MAYQSKVCFRKEQGCLRKVAEGGAIDVDLPKIAAKERDNLASSDLHIDRLDGPPQKS